jgi:hypothetical protein
MWMKKLSNELNEVRWRLLPICRSVLTQVLYRRVSPPSSTAPATSRPTSRAGSAAPPSCSSKMLLLKRELSILLDPGNNH